MLDTSAVLQLYSLLFLLAFVSRKLHIQTTQPGCERHTQRTRTPGPGALRSIPKWTHTEHTLTHSRLQNKNFNTPAEACLVSARHSARQNTKADSVLALRTTSSIIHTSYIANQPHPAPSLAGPTPISFAHTSASRSPLHRVRLGALASLGGIAYHDEPL